MSEYVAGRELDELIAEKVMGLCVHKLTGDIPETARTGKTTYRCVKCESTGFDYTTDYEGRICYPGAFSTSIVDAWIVLEKMKESAMVSVTWYPDAQCWNCKIWPKGRETQNVEADSYTTPELAICRAALAAIEPAKRVTDSKE